ncbi:enoyl-CoA hydratase [Brevundimonas diminuta]|nr:putative enoyl-CoA hydratase [Brevundimonas diminuta ATCC 11568]OWR17970.1 enoyl-CoA hydratase [Brevundimonas diminuta]OYX21666.1 MAG: enoyl-CoA hydratase [Brevundimonas diminuta]
MEVTMSDPVLYRQNGGVVSIVLNRPDRLNAIDPGLAEAFLAAAERAVADKAARVVIIKGQGRAFMAGGDLAYFREAGAEAPAAAWRLIGPLHRAIALLAESPLITIAELQGAVAGGGMSLALATDLAVCADTARFDMAYLKVAASPDCSGSWSLVRHLGLRRAMGVALLGQTLSASEALALGLVNSSFPADQLSTEVKAIADRLCSGPREAIAATKRLLRAAGDKPLEEQLETEAEAFVTAAGSSDFREAMSAFFERRPPQFE